MNLPEDSEYYLFLRGVDYGLDRLKYELDKKGQFFKKSRMDGEKWNINCSRCGKFILTEEHGSDGEIHCVYGSYDDGFYDDIKDEFYCEECAKELGKL